MCFLYVIQSGNRDMFKVGFTSTNVEKRKKELQTGNPDKLHTVYELEHDDAWQIEQKLHARLAGYLTEAQNEWFNITKESLFKIIERETSGLHQEESETSRNIGNNVRQIWGRQQHTTASGREDVLHTRDTPIVPTKRKHSFFSIGAE